MPFADKLKKLRLENNMTQKNVADRIKVARTTITGYETKGRQPSHEKLAALAALFHVSVDYLLDKDELIQLTVSQTDPTPVLNQNFLSRCQRLSPQSRQDLLTYLHLLELRDKEQNL